MSRKAYKTSPIPSLPMGSLVSIIWVSGGTSLALAVCLGIIHQSLNRDRDIMETALGRPTFQVRVGARSFAALATCTYVRRRVYHRVSTPKREALRNFDGGLEEKVSGLEAWSVRLRVRTFAALAVRTYVQTRAQGFHADKGVKEFRRWVGRKG